MKTKILLLMACWVGLTTISQAQEDSLSWDLSLSDLMDITIASATKSEVRQIETPQAVTVITSRDIERIAANNLGELLRGVVGMNVVRIHSSQNVVTSRGANAFSPSKLLILIDGQPITPTVFSATWYELLPIAMNDIERLEIIRSPGTIYGASAENGVINIISKKATDDGLKVDAQLAYGQQSMMNGGLAIYGKANKLSYRISGGIYTMDPYTNTEVLETVPGKPIDHGEQHFDNKKMLNTSTVNAALTYKLDNGAIALNAGSNFIGNAQGRIPDRLCFIDIEGNVAFANVGYIYI